MGNQVEEMEDENRLDLDAAEFIIPAHEEVKNNIGGDFQANLAVEPISPRAEEGEGEDEENGNQEVNQHDAALAAAGVGLARKKKKSKKKSKSKRGLNAPSGFEEFYVDVPVTPAEHEEEKGLYHESLLFSDRIQTAIQRYFAKRNLNSERKDVFDKYMSYGGISSGQKMFSGGLDSNTLAKSNAEDIRRITATHFAPPGRGGPDDPDFIVDFEGCAKGFLSSRLPSVLDLSQEQSIKSHTAIIRNFLNYILHHDVCPEYNDQIYAARRVCDQAEQELWKIAQAQPLLPGDFNRACSEIFGGLYQGLYVADDEKWAEGVETGFMSPEAARKTFRIALAAQASEAIFEKYKAQTTDRSISVTSVFEGSLQVTETIPATQEALNIYKRPQAAGLRPIGKLRAAVWANPLDMDEDLTIEEEETAASLAAAASAAPIEYEFWVEDELLRHCFRGMKFETQVHRTSFGLDYFDVITGVWCSFFSLLPNELMIGWREPGPRLPMREKAAGEERAWDGEGDEGGEEGSEVGDKGGEGGEGGEGREEKEHGHVEEEGNEKEKGSREDRREDNGNKAVSGGAHGGPAETVQKEANDNPNNDNDGLINPVHEP